MLSIFKLSVFSSSFFRLFCDSEPQMNLTGMWLTLVFFLLALIVVPIFDKSSMKFSTQSIAAAGIMLALSVGLSYVRLYRMPQGGSITILSTFPIMLYSYVYGTKKGVFVGLAYGLIQLLIDPFVIHPVQVILDYPLPFAFLGLAGMLRNAPLGNRHWLKFLIGGTVVCLLRYFTHVFSGVYAFAFYATGELWAYSLAYNSFALIDVGIAVAVGTLLMLNKQIIRIIEQAK